MRGGFRTVVPCVQTTSGFDQIVECDMILAGFRSPRRGEEIHESGFGNIA